MIKVNKWKKTQTSKLKWSYFKQNFLTFKELIQRTNKKPNCVKTLLFTFNTAALVASVPRTISETFLKTQISKQASKQTYVYMYVPSFEWIFILNKSNWIFYIFYRFF